MLCPKKLNDGKTVVGTHSMLALPLVMELIAECGFDFIWIDTEHASTSPDQLLNNMIAARAGGAASIASISWNDMVRLKLVLEVALDHGDPHDPKI